MIAAPTAFAGANVGNTPLVEVQVRIAVLTHRVLVKLESLNPGGGSIKARTAHNIYRRALESGQVVPGGTIVESSSGNLAKALAIQGAEIGLTVIAVVDPMITPMNLAAIEAAGAIVEMVDRSDENGSYLGSRLERVQQIRERVGAFWPNQYASAANPEAHYLGTGAEIVRDAPEAAAIFVACSTGGTAAGINRKVVETGVATTVVPVDVPGSHALVPGTGRRLLPGVGASNPSVFATPELRQRTMVVPDQVGIAVCRALRTATDLSVGGSSGVALAAALEWLAGRHETTTVVVVAADSGANYEFGDDALRRRGIAPPSISHLFDDLFMPLRAVRRTNRTDHPHPSKEQ